MIKCLVSFTCKYTLAILTLNIIKADCICTQIHPKVNLSQLYRNNQIIICHASGATFWHPGTCKNHYGLILLNPFPDMYMHIQANRTKTRRFDGMKFVELHRQLIDFDLLMNTTLVGIIITVVLWVGMTTARCMMTSSNGNFSALLVLCAENSPDSHTKASIAEVWCFLWATPE